MKIVPAYSNAPEKTIELAKAMASFCSSLQQFSDSARAAWPKLSIYKGGTHWRFLTEGKSDGESFYLDLEETR